MAKKIFLTFLVLASMFSCSRNVIVEDIVDTGLTIKKVVEYLYTLGVNSVEVVTLLDKPARREVEVNPKYIGLT